MLGATNKWDEAEKDLRASTRDAPHVKEKARGRGAVQDGRIGWGRPFSQVGVAIWIKGQERLELEVFTELAVGHSMKSISGSSEPSLEA